MSVDNTFTRRRQAQLDEEGWKKIPKKSKSLIENWRWSIVRQAWVCKDCFELVNECSCDELDEINEQIDCLLERIAQLREQIESRRSGDERKYFVD